MVERESGTELMAPAGDWECAKAAVDNGADAIYFGLQDGFNARARAANFTTADLPELMTFLRTRGVRGYLTLNTLVFGDELDAAERIARLAVIGGVDAVLVQDLGLARLLNRLCPELPLHASTQMTLSSAECIAEVRSLGVRRVVLPRELSIEQIEAIRRQADVELEVFVHGALCISYSGQCLASLSMGGRSANRGQCAQPCRLPYEVLAENDGGHRPDAARRFPLSPHDLAAYDHVPKLIAAGVSAMKIEGRLKSADYVGCVTRYYRAAIDQARNATQKPTAGLEHAANDAIQELADLEQTYSRGFCHGWLDGDHPRSLVSGDGSAHRGTALGVVKGVRGQRIVVELVASVRRGDGILFEGAEQGGRVYEVFQGGRSIADDVAAGQVELAFRHDSIDTTKITSGQKVWKTDDPQAERRLRKEATQASRQRRVTVDMTIDAAVGQPLRITAVAATGARCSITSPDPLAEAAKHPITKEMLVEQLGRLGKTPYTLRRVDANIHGRPMIPLSVLGKMRHQLIEQLDAAAAQPPHRTMSDDPILTKLRESKAVSEEGGNGSVRDTMRHVHVLCRSVDQVAAAAACDVASIIVDLPNASQRAEAMDLARRRFKQVWLATPRIHMPGEGSALEKIARLKPDGVLVRNLAALAFFKKRNIPTVADFSLNAVNDLTVDLLLSHGADRVTAAYDLNRERLMKLADTVDPARLEVVVHRHTPMFHTRYCLFCRTFSNGSDRRDCGRPCERGVLRLRDRLGVEHPVLVDSECRNTVFHAESENLTEAIPALQNRGVRHFRVELLGESEPDQVRRLISRVSG